MFSQPLLWPNNGNTINKLVFVKMFRARMCMSTWNTLFYAFVYQFVSCWIHAIYNFEWKNKKNVSDLTKGPDQHIEDLWKKYQYNLQKISLVYWK